MAAPAAIHDCLPNPKTIRKTSRDYPLLSGGDINLYCLFVERASRLVKKTGSVGLIVPSGIAADYGAAPSFRSISTTGRLGTLFDFENGKRKPEPFFPDVHRSFKFCALIFGGPEKFFPQADCAFFQQDAAAAEQNAFPLAPADFDAVNPNTGTAPVFRNERDAAITRAIYARIPVLVDRRKNPPQSVWPVRYCTMFHMTNDSDKFITAAELEKRGAYRLKNGNWEKGDQRFLPLYEGKMVQAYDHRAASIVVNPENLNRPAQPEPATDAQHKDPAWLPAPQFYVDVLSTLLPQRLPAAIGFKDVTAATNVRTMIAAFVAPAGYGNTLPVLLPNDLEVDEYKKYAPYLLANLNAIILDYVARQKVQGNHVNFYIVEQLPIIPEKLFSQKFGPKSAADIIKDDVLHLTYTSHDMAPFAQDQGFSGPPFLWDEEDRLRRRARLDAVFFHLYGIAREDAEYILTTFPIVRREEEQKYGRFRSRALILAYMAALGAGKPDADAAG